MTGGGGAPAGEDGVVVLWLDLLLSVGAVVQAACGGAVAWALAVYAGSTGRKSRRVAALSLSLVGCALLLEALLFLSQGPRAGELSRASLAALLLARPVLFAAALLTGSLVWRARLR